MPEKSVGPMMIKFSDDDVDELIVNGVRYPATSEVVCYVDDDDSGPVVRLTVEADEDGPVITRFSVERLPDGPPVTAAVLRKLDFASVFEAAVKGIGRVVAERDREQMRLLVGDVRDVLGADQSAHQRRTMNDRLLREVAALYLADNGGAPTKAVAAGLGTSHRNATRYVALARQSGLLPPYGSDIDNEEN